MKTVEELKWLTKEPEKFPCLLNSCEKKATKRVLIDVDEEGKIPDVFRLVLCEDCAKLPEEKLRRMIQ